jgi:hypothetical protein
MFSLQPACSSISQCTTPREGAATSPSLFHAVTENFEKPNLALPATHDQRLPAYRTIRNVANVSSRLGVVISIVIPLSILALLGIGVLVVCRRRSRHSPATSDSSDSSSDTYQVYRDDEPNVSPPFFPAGPEQASETVRDMSVEPSGIFPAPESSVPRSRMHSQHFELGSPVSTSSEEDASDQFTGLDDPASDTAFISSLARPPTPNLPSPAIRSVQQSTSEPSTIDPMALVERRASPGEQKIGRPNAPRLAVWNGAARDTKLRATTSTADIVL